MIRKGHHIDEYFSSGLGKLDITPPEGVWGNIENKLDQKKKVRILWYKAGLAAGIALILGVSGTIFVTNNNKNITPLANNTKTTAPIETINANNNGTIKTDKNSDNSISNNGHSVISVSNNSVNNSFKTAVAKNNNTISPNKQVEIPETYTAFVPKDKCEPQHIQNVENNEKHSLNLAYLSIHEINTPAYNSTSETLPEQVFADKPAPRRWSIDCEFAPTYAYRAITNTSGNSLSSSAYNSNESGLLAWSGGIRAGYKLNKKFHFKIGLYYSIMGQRISNLYTVINNNASNYYPGFNVNKPVKANSSADINIPNSLGTITNAHNNNYYDYSEIPTLNSKDNSYIFVNNSNLEMSPNNIYGSITYKKVEGDILQKLHYIDIPIIMHYTLIEKKLKCHILGGINTEILYKTTALLKTNDSKKELDQNIDLKPVNVSSVIGLGLQYPIRHRIHLLIEPTFKYSINSVINSTNRDVHLYSFNLYTGFSFTL